MPEPFEEVLCDPFPKFAECHRLVSNALLERHDLAPSGRACLPDRRGAFESAVLVEQRVSESRLPRDTPRRGLEIASDDLEDRRLAGAVASDDAPPLTLGDGEGDV